MTIPTSILFTDVIFGDRARTTYDNIELLANSIRDVGLLCPIILSPLDNGKFLLEDGGRRYRALESLGVKELFHATTGNVNRPGFITKSEASDLEQSTLTELIANLHREDLDWRDEVKLIVKAWRVKKLEADRNSEPLYHGVFGKMLGNYGQADIKAAIYIHDELIAHPERFKDCSSVFTAYKVLLDDIRRAAEAEKVGRMKAPSPETTIQLDVQGEVIAEEQSPIVSLSPFRLGNSLEWMEREHPSFDHIICDPDFAVDVERLESNSSNASTGVVQSSVNQSLADLQRFISLAADAVRGYLIFWYDLDHHEKLAAHSASCGFLVQRWPITWFKPDHQSNAAPQHNFTKNVEWAMVCRKPSATLATAAPSSVITLPKGNTTNAFGHPFAKPVDLWMRIFSAVCTPGQSVFDPFMGSGSSVVAAIRYGLQSFGMELQEQHYNTALLNVQKEYQRTISNVQFTK